MRRSWWEAGAVALALAVLAAAVYGPNAVHGGFLSDAWANRAIYVFAPQEGFFGGVDRFFDEPNVAARPLYAVYLSGLNAVLGSHMDWWLAWLIATSVLMSLSVYLLLRKLDFALLDAALIAALILIFPATSSLRLWAATVQIPVSISCAAFGFLLALAAFDARKGRRRGLLHCASLAMFVVSLLFYEAVLPVMLTSVFLYRLRVPWSRAALRWVVDVMVLVSTTAIVGSFSSEAKEVQGLAGMLNHAATIVDQSWLLLGTVILPFGSDSWYVLGLVGMIPLAAVIVALRLSPENTTRMRLQRWLLVLAAGLGVVVLGYAIFVPGIDYYAPLGPGIANRINAVPSIGWVLVLYSLITLASILAFRELQDSGILRLGAVTLACALVGAGWVRASSQDADAFTTAFREDERILAVVRNAVPEPPPESTIWTFGQPVEIVPGVPVFGNTWDMTSSVQLLYGDSTIRSFVGYPGTTFECRSDSIVPGGNASYPPEVSDFSSSYGRTYFVETTTGRLADIRTPAQCAHAARSFKRSPAYPEW